MSERYARSCAKKRHYSSERRAAAAAKESQKRYGVPMNEYPCEWCKGKWVVGNTLVANARSQRNAPENNPENIS